MNSNYIVTKSNKLICARYDLSAQEQKIILTLASMVQPKDEEFKPYKFKIQDFIKLLNIKDQSKYKEIPFLTKELMKKVFEIKEGNKIIQLSWLSSAKYEIGSGVVELCFDPNLKPYFLHLKEMYTTYRLENILGLKSKYSIRIYELLKGSCFKSKKYGYVEFDLQELKTIIGANTNSYKTYSNFKNRVLLKAQEELNKKTDIIFKFEEIKKGRKIISIRFFIKSNKSKKKVDAQQEITATLEDVQEEVEHTDLEYIKVLFKDTGLNKLDAKKIYNTACKVMKDKGLEISIKDYLTERKNMVDDYAERNDLEKGYLATLLDCIKKWTPNQKQYTKKDSFNNYEQRQYNFDDLERKLLGWDAEQEEQSE